MLDLLVLGSGVAGLSAAVRAADTHGMRVGVLTKAELHQATTRWAQGGVAAVLGGADPDSADLHLADTLAAGAGLCDADAVRVLVDEGPGRVHELIALGAIFDRDEHGRLELAREGGHSHARVVHAGGAATGAEVERALVEAARATAAVVHESCFALDLLVEGGRCRGVRSLDADGRLIEVRAEHVLLATGGAGQLFSVTTNPVEATGDGVAMALRAGVAVADVEFVQFHPTALHHPAMPRPLLSEALRGHGALLRDADGERFVDELLPRDMVSRAMTARMLEQDVDHLWLDATGLERFDERFPTIAAALTEVGLDPRDRLAADRAGRALLLRRHGDRPRRRVVAARPVGRGRDRRQRRPRRQPPRLQLAARRHGVRARVSSRRSSGARTGPTPTGRDARGARRRRRGRRSCASRSSDRPTTTSQARPKRPTRSRERAAAGDDPRRGRPALGRTRSNGPRPRSSSIRRSRRSDRTTPAPGRSATWWPWPAP